MPLMAASLNREGTYSMPNKPAILAEGLQKHYGQTHALAGLDLVAEQGSVLGVLGPNGAGKTTASTYPDNTLTSRCWASGGSRARMLSKTLTRSVHALV